MAELKWASDGAEGELVLVSGHRVHLRRLAGIVADDRHTSDTRIRSVGGGGYVGPHGGTIAAPEIRSTTTTRQTVWITDDRGRDHAVSFTNTEIPVRAGQRLSALFCRFDNPAVERCECVANHGSQLYYQLGRTLRPLVNFESFCPSRPFTTLLQWALFLGSALIFLPSFQPAGDRGAQLAAESRFCANLRPRDLRMTPQRRESLERSYDSCQRALQRDVDLERAARHAWWVPVACGLGWVALRIRSVGRKIAFVRRLREDYLHALDRWASDELSAARAPAGHRPVGPSAAGG